MRVYRACVCAERARIARACVHVDARGGGHSRAPWCAVRAPGRTCGPGTHVHSYLCCCATCAPPQPSAALSPAHAAQFHLFIKIPPVSEPPQARPTSAPGQRRHVRAVCALLRTVLGEGRLCPGPNSSQSSPAKTQRSKTATRHVSSPGDGAAPGSAGTGRAVLRPPGPTGTGSAQQPHSHVPQPGPLSGCGCARTRGAWRGSACRHAQVWAGRSAAAQRCAVSSGRRRSAGRERHRVEPRLLEPRTRPSPPPPYLPTAAAVVAAAQQGEGSTAGRAVAAGAVRHPLGPAARSCWENVKGKQRGGHQGSPPRSEQSHPAGITLQLHRPLPALRSPVASLGLGHRGQSATWGTSPAHRSPSSFSAGTKVFIWLNWGRAQPHGCPRGWDVWHALAASIPSWALWLHCPHAAVTAPSPWGQEEPCPVPALLRTTAACLL